jgi:serine protease Do
MHDRFSLFSLFVLGLYALPACEPGAPAHAQTTGAARTQLVRAGSDIELDTLLAERLSDAFRGAATRALPALVQVNVTARFSDTRPRRGVPIPALPDSARTASSGSGFLIDDGGHVITNFHVIMGAERIGVLLSDGRDFEAEVVGADPNTDVAVIRLIVPAGTPLPVAEIGDPDALEVGDWVLALGNPLGYEFTVTAGVVSAKGRTTGILLNRENTQLESFIQTDAPINPGNSGGPLVDLFGRVVGVNTAIESPTGFFSGAGFAIPIDLARKVAGDLIRFGEVHRPRLGVSLQDVTAADADVYRLPRVEGAEVVSVALDMPARAAGIEIGDIILAVNGATVRSVTELQSRIALLHPGDRVTLQLHRYGDRLSRTVQLSSFDPAPRREPPERAERSGMELLGFQVVAMPDNQAMRAGLPAGQGVMIREIDRYGAAWQREFQQPGYFALLTINGQEIRTVGDVGRLAEGLRVGQVVSIIVQGTGRPDDTPTILNYRLR